MITLIVGLVSFLTGTCSTWLCLRTLRSQELEDAISGARVAFAEEIHQDLI